MIKWFFALLIALAWFVFPTAYAAPQAATPIAEDKKPSEMTPTTPVVLELFTSQDCTFCPQADALMGQMRLQDNVIVLSCHVDYFASTNKSMGQRFCTERQDTYNKLIGSGPRYTPQLIVNGQLDVIGYDAGRVSAAVMKARQTPIKTISIVSKSPSAFSLNLPDLEKGSYNVSLMMVDRPRTLTQTQGAQKGRTETYYNVVSGLKNLGPYDGVKKTLDIDLSFTPENQGFSVLVQDEKTGHIVAAGTISR
jgi:hypothetical protein